jgi:hypothetical protein
VVEYDGVSASLEEHESRDDCSLRQNLQNESNRSEGSEKKRRKVVSQKVKLLVDIFRGRNDCRFLKEWQEKTEEAESHNPVFYILQKYDTNCYAVPSQCNCRNTSENLSADCANGSICFSCV